MKRPLHPSRFAVAGDSSTRAPARRSHRTPGPEQGPGAYAAGALLPQPLASAGSGSAPQDRLPACRPGTCVASGCGPSSALVALRRYVVAARVSGTEGWGPEEHPVAAHRRSEPAPTHIERSEPAPVRFDTRCWHRRERRRTSRHVVGSDDLPRAGKKSVRLWYEKPHEIRARPQEGVMALFKGTRRATPPQSPLFSRKTAILADSPVFLGKTGRPPRVSEGLLAIAEPLWILVGDGASRV